MRDCKRSIAVVAHSRNIFSTDIYCLTMPFVPRSQRDQNQQLAAAPPIMVVETNYQQQPPIVPQSAPSNPNTDEQLAELNELLAHVLEELSSMKKELHLNAPKAQKQIHKLKAQSKRSQKESEDKTTEDVEPSDESEEEEERDAVPPLRKPHAARSTPARTKGYDFSSCF